MASIGGPDAEFGDTHRKELLEALKDALPAYSLTEPTMWACLWLSDIECLENLVTQTQQLPALTTAAFNSIESQTRLIPTWTQRKRAASVTSTPQHLSASPRPSTPLQPPLSLQSPSTPSRAGQKQNSSGQTRSKLQADLCRERDQKKCVLTKAGDPIDVAHIYPFSMRYENNTARQHGISFWDALRLFWSKERVDAWYSAIFPTGTEVCHNLLCLCPNAHRYWERGYFALKPISISDDKRCLDLQFFWLPSTRHTIELDIMQVPSLSATDDGINDVKLNNIQTNRNIRSGDIIPLKTSDPASHPLPDFKLLEMQWFLQRLTAMSGAAETEDNFFDEDSDGDIAPIWQNRWNMDMEDDAGESAERWGTLPKRF